jgi:hypothetical protein
MTRAILKSIYDRAKSIVVILTLAFVMVGCYTVSSVDEPSVSVTYTYGYGYYWGAYGHYYPWMNWYPYYNVYPRYYVAPHRIHVPSYYDKHPEYKTRDFGTKRTPPPKQGEHKSPPPQNNRQGNRR